jgi:two-component system, NarL family, nitrate/nitrite response regulator NarL
MPTTTAKSAKLTSMATRSPAQPADPRNRSDQTIRLLIANDHSIFRAGLRRLLEAQQDFAVVGEAASADEVVAITLEQQPALLLFNGMTGIDEVAARLRGLSDVKILLLAADIEKPAILRALRLGVRGVVPGRATPELLFKSIRSVMAGEYWIGCDVVADLVQLMRQAPETGTARHAPQTFGLTERERDIVGAIVAGYANRDIASKFTLREDTVKHHLTNIFDKTGTSNRLELALFALHHRLVDHH